jgi:metal-responsive CopG/Arc/MetJ family transcriptional regulator
MKTAIFIPDELFQAAEQFARRHRMSRSELYAKALQQYLQEHRSQAITEQLDAIYATASSTLDSALAHMQTRSIRRAEP